MLLTQILHPACIKVPLSSTDKESAITELVELLVEHNLLTEKETILEAVLTREQTRSTGIGSGIAIPHGKCSGTKELVMAMGTTSVPIDFNSIDSKPVSIIILLISPIDRTGPHIQALARISRLMLDEDFKNKLASSKSAEDIYEMISEKEAEN